MTPIYLDYNATTPIDPAATGAMLPYLRDHYGKPVRHPPKRSAPAGSGGSLMSASITVEKAQATLKKLIAQLAPGEELVITENQQPVAKLDAHPPRPAPGLGKGSILYMAPDFDEPLEEFREYME